MTSSAESSRKPRSAKKSAMPTPEQVRARLDGATDLPLELRSVMDEVRAAGADAVASSDESTRAVVDLANRYFTVLESQLAKPTLTRDEEQHLRDQMTWIFGRLEAKDTENKAFHARIAHDRMKVAVAGLGVLGLAIAGPDGLKQLVKALPETARKAIGS